MVFQFLLMFSTVKRYFDMCDFFEFRMTFILRVNKVLYFCHLELSYSYQTISRSNFISEAETDLSSSKRKTTAVELSQFVEVNKHTLSSFWSEIANKISWRTNLGLEHQVERFSWGKIVSCIGRFNFKLFICGIHLLFAQTINFNKDFLILLQFVFFELTFLNFRF